MVQRWGFKGIDTFRVLIHGSSMMHFEEQNHSVISIILHCALLQKIGLSVSCSETRSSSVAMWAAYGWLDAWSKVLSQCKSGSVFVRLDVQGQVCNSRHKWWTFHCTLTQVRIYNVYQSLQILSGLLHQAAFRLTILQPIENRYLSLLLNRIRSGHERWMSCEGCVVKFAPCTTALHLPFKKILLWTEREAF